MPCRMKRMPDGNMMVLCGHVRGNTCVVCGKSNADRLCDWETGPEKTCDRPLHRSCAGHPGPVFGHPECTRWIIAPKHYAMYKAQKEVKHVD
jgi:hypothetical protein